MRPAPHDVRCARLQRGPLVAIAWAGVCSLFLSAVAPRLEPWLGPPRPALLALMCGAAFWALAVALSARKASAWSTADDAAWIVTLCALSVLAGACTAPVGIGLVLYATAAVTLAVRDPSNTLVLAACATTVNLPIVRLFISHNFSTVVPFAFATALILIGFLTVLGQTRRLVRALAERDAVLFERTSASPRGAVTVPANLAPITAPRANTTWRTSSNSFDSHRTTRNGGDNHEQSWDALVERLRSSVTVMAENAGVVASVQVELSGLAPPSSKIRMNLLRIAQEATTQALRHGEPRSIVVRLRRGDGGVVFELQDDGEASEAVRQKRALAPLRGRAAAMGGTAEVRRADGGWVTRVRLPCEQLN